MGTNITNAESAILVGRARWLRWLDNWTEQWNQPVFDAVVLRWWDTLNPAVKTRMQEEFPEQFKEIEKRVEALRDQKE